ncbi:MAG: NUDIX domain-containing protein [Chloroflexota bacterium]
MMKTLLRLWRTLPLWMHILAAKLARPRFRAAVAALIFDEQGRILLFKHTYRNFEWGIPAGGVEYREQPADAIVREFYEETSMQIEIERLLTVVSAREDHHISMVYLCRIVSGEFKESHEISEIKYFSVDEMPAMMLTTEKELIKWAVKEVRR